MKYWEVEKCPRRCFSRAPTSAHSFLRLEAKGMGAGEQGKEYEVQSWLIVWCWLLLCCFWTYCQPCQRSAGWLLSLQRLMRDWWCACDHSRCLVSAQPYCAWDNGKSGASNRRKDMYERREEGAGSGGVNSDHTIVRTECIWMLRGYKAFTCQAGRRSAKPSELLTSCQSAHLYCQQFYTSHLYFSTVLPCWTYSRGDFVGKLQVKSSFIVAALFEWDTSAVCQIHQW